MTELVITFRHATPADSAFAFEVSELAMREYAEATWGKWDRDLQSDLHRQRFRTEGLSIIWVDTDAAGLLSMEEQDDHIQLETLFLLPAFQNRGIGSRILESLSRRAKEVKKPVRLRVLRVNTKAQQLYLRHGYVVIDSTPERIFMERR